MRAPRPFQSINQRIEAALAAAAEADRTPVELVLGKEDYPVFEAWARAIHGVDVLEGGYRGLRVRHNPTLFLSRLRLPSKPGSPTALLPGAAQASALRPPTGALLSRRARS